LDDAYPSMRTASQPRGWETRAVLEDVGYEGTEIEQLLADGAAQAYSASAK